MNATVTTDGGASPYGAGRRLAPTRVVRSCRRAWRRWCETGVCLRGCASACGAGAIAIAAFALVSAGWRAVGVGSTTEGRAALAALEKRVARARAEVAEARRANKSARMPALDGSDKAVASADWGADAGGHAGAATGADAGAGAHAGAGVGGVAIHGGAAADAGVKPGADADPWPALFALVTDSRLTLRVLEPLRNAGQAQQAGTTLRLAASGDFSALTRFLSGLAGLPAVTRLSGLRVTREAAGLGLDMALEMLQPWHARQGRSGAVDSQRPERRFAADPFQLPVAARPADRPEPRLMGVLDDGVRQLALFETDNGVVARGAGEPVDGERLVRFGGRAALLHGSTGTRHLSAEARALEAQAR